MLSRQPPGSAINNALSSISTDHSTSPNPASFWAQFLRRPYMLQVPTDQTMDIARAPILVSPKVQPRKPTAQSSREKRDVGAAVSWTPKLAKQDTTSKANIKHVMQINATVAVLMTPNLKKSDTNLNPTKGLPNYLLSRQAYGTKKTTYGNQEAKY